MSGVKFNIHYGGYWLKSRNGDLDYIGGEIQIAECLGVDIFDILEAVIVGGLSSGYKVWYKLPEEDFKERKELVRDDHDTVKTMAEAGNWSGELYIYVVNSLVYPADVYRDIDEDVRAGISDELLDSSDEDIDYHNTPPNSENEGDEDDIEVVKCKRGSGLLMLRQVFDSLDEFKEALVDYVLKTRYNIEICRYGTDHSGAKCSDTSCSWCIFCSYEAPAKKWMVKRYDDQHICHISGYSKIIKAPVIAKILFEDIRSDPEIKPKALQEQLRLRYGLMTTNHKCRKAKAKALKIIEKDHEEQFSRLRDYQTELLRSNEGSTVVLDMFTEEGSGFFRRFYVCFAVVKEMWISWCRPIFGLDACFLKCTLKGQLLAAVGRDANNGMYPIAWAVVDVENEENWQWFIHILKSDLKLRDGGGLTIISDRQKGLLNVVDAELPHVEHRMCARHIYANLKKSFPQQFEMKRLFWRLAESYTQPEYESNLAAIKEYDIRLYDAVLEKNPKNASIAFCSPKSCCVDIHNNISESFNNAIDPARFLPMVEMLETIKRKTMIRIDLRRTKSLRLQGRFTPRVMTAIESEQEKAVKYCRMIPGAEGRCEVLESGHAVGVNIRLRECACRRWQMSGVPCRHALRVFSELKLNVEDYISSWFLNTTQQCIYSNNIRPVNGMKYWERSGTVILPPPSLARQTVNTIGRKPKPKRRKGRAESPQKKVTRKKRIMHCGKCGFEGHNATKCKNVGVLYKRNKCKKRTANAMEGEPDSGYESMSLECGEGPSQPTQHSTISN